MYNDGLNNTDLPVSPPIEAALQISDGSLAFMAFNTITAFAESNVAITSADRTSATQVSALAPLSGVASLGNVQIIDLAVDNADRIFVVSTIADSGSHTGRGLIGVTARGPGAGHGYPGNNLNGSFFASTQTTVAVGSNGTDLGSFVGAGTLNVASTTGFPTSGSIVVAASFTGVPGFARVTYTGKGGTTFTGCTMISPISAVVSTGGGVGDATNPVAGLSALWLNTGGGIGGAGHLLVVWSGTDQQGYCILDAGTLGSSLTTVGTTTAAGPAPTFLTAGPGAGLCLGNIDIAPSALFATSGASVAQGTGSNTVAVGAWAVNSSGVLSTNTLTGTITTSVHLNSTFGTLQIIRVNTAPGYVVLYEANPGGFNSLSAAYVTGATINPGVSVGRSVPGTPSTWGFGPNGQVYADPFIANQFWIAFPNSITPTTLSRMRATVNTGSGAVAWDSALQTVDTLPVSVTAVRVPKQPRAGIVDVIINAPTIGTQGYLGGVYSLLSPQPAAPTLVAPAFNAVVDLAAGQQFSWTPDPANVESGIAFTREVTPGGSIEWWTGSAFQAAECWLVPYTTNTLTFAAGLWADNDTAYQWAVRTLSPLLVPSVAPFPYTVIGSVLPQATSITFGATGTSLPTVSWTFTAGTGETVQTSYRVLVGPSGWNPVTTAPTFDTGIVISPATGPITLGTAPLGLAQGVYDVYVVVTSSDNATSGFTDHAAMTISYSRPTTPTLTAVYDAVHNRVTLVVSDSSASPALFTVITRSDGVVVRSTASGLALTGGGPQTVTTFDYEVQPSTAYTYTAQVYSAGPLVSLASAASASVTATVTAFWISDPLTPGSGLAVYLSPPFDQTIMETETVHRPLGRTTPVVVSDVILGQDGKVDAVTVTPADFAALIALITANPPKVLLLQSPFGAQWYIRISSARTPKLDFSAADAPYRTTSFGYVQVTSP